MTGASNLGSFLSQYKIETTITSLTGGYLSRVGVAVVPITPMQRMMGFIEGDVRFGDIRVGPYPFWKTQPVVRGASGDVQYAYPHQLEYRCATCEDAENGNVLEIKQWLQDFLQKNWRGEEFKPGFGLSDPILAWTSNRTDLKQDDIWQYIDEELTGETDNSCENPIWTPLLGLYEDDEDLFPPEGILRWDGRTDIQGYSPCFFYSPCYKARPPGLWDGPNPPTLHIPCIDPISANACPVYVNEEYRKCRAARKGLENAKALVDQEIQSHYMAAILGGTQPIPSQEEIVINWCANARRIYQFDGRWWIEQPGTGNLWFGGDWYESPSRDSENLGWIPYIPGLGVPIGRNLGTFEDDEGGCNVRLYLDEPDIRTEILTPSEIPQLLQLGYGLVKWLRDSDLWYAPPDGFVLADQSDCGS